MRSFRFVVFHETPPEIADDWLSLGYLISALRKIPDLDISCSFYLAGDYLRAVEEEAQKPVDILGLPVLQFSYHPVTEFVKLIRTRMPDTHIVLGNKEASAHAELILNTFPEIDSIVVGEGERTLYELVGRVIGGESLEGCKGVCSRKGDTVVMNESRPLETNLDSLGFPDRTIVHSPATHFSVLASRGCAGHCTFCVAESPIEGTGHRVRCRTAGHVLDELEYLVQVRGAQYITFNDSTFCGNGTDIVAWYARLYQGMKERGLDVQFAFNTRAELVNGDTIDAIHNLKEVGLDVVFLGLDAGNEEDLRLYGKRATLSDNVNAVRLLREAQVPFDYGFITFNPYSTFKRLDENIRFLEDSGLFVYSFTLSAAYDTHSRAKLVRKLEKDGLLTTPVDMPIVKDKAYRFQDERVGRARYALKQVYTVPVPKLEHRKARTLRNRLTRVPSAVDPDSIIAFTQALARYEEESSRIGLALMRKALRVAEQGETDVPSGIQADVDDYISKMQAAWMPVGRMQLPLHLKMRKTG